MINIRENPTQFKPSTKTVTKTELTLFLIFFDASFYTHAELNDIAE